MATAIYVRVSTEDQAKHGYSIAEQIRQCKQKAGTDTVLEYIDDGVSGEFLDRPALSKLRQDVKDGLIDKVICYDPDRLSRKLVNQLLVSEEIEKRAELIFVNGDYAKTPEGMLFYQLRGAVAEFEKAKINERMSSGRRQKARQGKVVRDYQIYGYNYDKQTAQFTINESEASVVRLIFDLFTKPNDIAKGINGIAKYLTAQGIPTKKNAVVWHRQVVRQILMNRAYIGEFYQNRWNTEGMLGNQFRSDDDKIPMTERPKDEWILTPCPAIISAEQFQYAQKLLGQSRRRWAGSPKNDYFLSGLVRCGECGNTMTGRKSKNWGKYVYEYTCIKNTAGAKNSGCGHRVKCSELDEHVWNHIHQWLTEPDEVAATMTEEPATEQILFEEAELARISKELERIANGRKRLLKLLTDTEDDTVDLVDDVRSQLRDLKDKETKLLEYQSQLEEIIAAQSSRQLTENLLQDAIEYYLTLNPDELTSDQKKELVRMVVREIRVYKDERVDIYTF
jgi:site-specific DNA recombinase